MPTARSAAAIRSSNRSGAKSYDLAFEWYSARHADFAGVFEKDVSSFITTLQSRGTFDQNPFGMPTSLATAACGYLRLQRDDDHLDV